MGEEEDEEQEPVRESAPTQDGVEVTRGTIVNVLCSELTLLGHRSRFTASEIDPQRLAVVSERVRDITDSGELRVNSEDPISIYSTFDAARDGQIRVCQAAVDEAKQRLSDAIEDLARAYSIALLDGVSAEEERLPLLPVVAPRDKR